jgi:pentatricopeptide repeat protein
MCQRSSFGGGKTGYAQGGHAVAAVKLFDQILQLGMMPNQSTFSNLLRACASLATLEQCEQVHSHIIKCGIELDIFMGNALVDAYSKCKSIENARQIFDHMSEIDVVTCTSMIAGYTQSGHGEKALELSWNMHCKGMELDQFAFSSALNACAGLSALEQGKQFHAHVFKVGYESDVFAGNALINMYAKCGSIEDACQTFYRIPERDVVSWTAVIAGCAHHGRGHEALHLFEQMLQVGIKPNNITLISVLSACNHAGLVDEACLYFESMIRDHGIEPGVEHYACLVDILGRTGQLDEAERLVNEMPFEPNASVWGSLLASSRTHGNTELGRRAAEHLFDLEPKGSGTHVLLANMYASAGRWEDVAKVRRMMKEGGIKKEPGCSWIEVKNTVHTFVADDTSHPQVEEIYAILERLMGQIEEVGYVPKTEFVLHDIEQNEKENLLYYHSEKLALAFGLISTCPGSPVRIMKNIRVCGDCHSAIKFISKIVDREIILRDTNRFHHFMNGLCSCGDYW